MPAADPDDDSITRWLVHHYRFDPERRERRNVLVACWDNEAEFQADIDSRARIVRESIDAGVRDDREHVSGTIWEPGHRTGQAFAREVRRAARRGEDVRALLKTGELPSNVAIFGWDEDGKPWSSADDSGS